MEISGEYRFEAPRNIVWWALLEPSMLQVAIPGCERFAEAEPGTYELTMRVGLAALKGTYSGEVRIVDPWPEEHYRIEVSGNGRPGTLEGEGDVQLESDGPATVVRYRGDFRARGMIAALGNRALAGSARLLLAQFFKSMDKQIGQRVV